MTIRSLLAPHLPPLLTSLGRDEVEAYKDLRADSQVNPAVVAAKTGKNRIGFKFSDMAANFRSFCYF